MHKPLSIGGLRPPLTSYNESTGGRFTQRPGCSHFFIFFLPPIKYPSENFSIFLVYYIKWNFKFIISITPTEKKNETNII